jgi:hypothetical protein
MNLSVSDPTARAHAIYDLGPTAIFAAKADPRFHYCLYVPPKVGDGAKVDLLVAVHGTGRTSFLDFRDGFAEFGRWNDCAVLCPIFPVGVLGDGNRSGYKYIAEGDIRYDVIVLKMVDELAANIARTGRASPCSAFPAADTSPTASPSCIPPSCGRPRSARRVR